MSEERKQWLRQQLDKYSECQLFNFGGNDGYDIHGDVEDLLTENAALKAKLLAVECADCGKTLLECECE